MRTSESTAKLSAALVAAQVAILNPPKNQTSVIPMKSGGSFRYNYADLPSILNTVRPILMAHGLVLTQELAGDHNQVGVATRLVHTSGEWIEYDALTLDGGNGARESGSAATYARRYTICAVLGIAADEDDDGAAVTPRRKQAEPASARSSASAPAEPTTASGATPAVAGDHPSAPGDDGESPPDAASGEGVTTAEDYGEGSEAVVTSPAEKPHEHVWADSPKLSKYEVCTVTDCLETRRKRAA